MRSKKIARLIYDIGDWLAKIIMLHLIWLVFTLAGLIIFGLMPATAAMFTVLRKWLTKEEVPMFRTFLKAYQSSFKEKNFLGLIYVGLGLFLYTDFKISYMVIQSSFLHVLIWVICVFYLTMLAFSFPIYAHYNLKTIDYLKQTFLIILSSPIQIVLLFITFTILYALFYYLPVIFIFAGSTMIALPVMWLGLRLFNKFEENLEVAEE